MSAPIRNPGLVIAAIKRVLAVYPDWRVAQVISNAAQTIGFEDVFYVEDEALAAAVLKLLENTSPTRRHPRS